MFTRVIFEGVKRDSGASLSLLWIEEYFSINVTNKLEPLVSKPGINDRRKLVVGFAAQDLWVLSPGVVVAPMFIAFSKMDEDNGLDSSIGALDQALSIFIQLV